MCKRCGKNVESPSQSLICKNRRKIFWHEQALQHFTSKFVRCEIPSVYADSERCGMNSEKPKCGLERNIHRNDEKGLRDPDWFGIFDFVSERHCCRQAVGQKLSPACGLRTVASAIKNSPTKYRYHRRRVCVV